MRISHVPILGICLLISAIAASAQTNIYRPTIWLRLGDAFPTNPTYAYDANDTTFATIKGVNNNIGGGGEIVEPVDAEVRYKGFPSVVGTPSSLTLAVTASADGTSNCTNSIWYSTSNNVAHYFSGQSGIHAKTTSSVSLPANTDLTQLYVEVQALCNPPNIEYRQVKVYEIWVLAQ